MPVETADRIWWAADDLWHNGTVLTSFVVKPIPALNAASIELPKSGAEVEPSLRLAVGIVANEKLTVSVAVSPQLEGILGEGCIRNAFQPLLEREARTGIWDYVAGLGFALVAAKVPSLGDRLARSYYWSSLEHRDGVIEDLLTALDAE